MALDQKVGIVGIEFLHLSRPSLLSISTSLCLYSYAGEIPHPSSPEMESL
jgi:hypothetical protein